MQWSHVKTFEFERVQLLLFFVCEKKKNYNAVHVKTFEFVCYCFYCLTSIFCFFLFCFCKTNFYVFTIFSELSGLKGNVLFMEIYTSMKSSILFLTKYAIFIYKRRRKKLFFNWLQEVIFPQFFSCFECKYVLIALDYGKIT